MATKQKASNEHKVVLTLPDMGLKTKEMTALKKQFENSIVESMGGKEALARRRIVVVIVVVVVTASPAEW